MALFGLIGESKKKTSSQQNSTKTSNKTGTAESSTQGTTKTQLLEDPIRNVVNQLVIGLAGSVDSNSASFDELATLLKERGLAAQDDLAGDNNAIIASARREGERGISRLQTNLAQDAGGSTKNTFVAGATAEAVADLEAKLAGQAGALNIQARQLGDQELMAAVSAFKESALAGSSDANAVAQLVGVLRGANSTTTVDENKLISTTDNIVEQLDALIKGTEKGSESPFSQIGLSFGVTK